MHFINKNRHSYEKHSGHRRYFKLLPWPLTHAWRCRRILKDSQLISNRNVRLFVSFWCSDLRYVRIMWSPHNIVQQVFVHSWCFSTPPTALGKCFQQCMAIWSCFVFEQPISSRSLHTVYSNTLHNYLKFENK